MFMTSDAKIGLLLGLVFIFIIAFVINGLPRFRRVANNNELTTNMVSLQNNPPGFGARQRRVSREVIKQVKPVKKQSLVETWKSAVNNRDVRFTTPLPKSPSVVKETAKVKPSKPPLSKISVVRDGDSLWQIAAEQLRNGSRYTEIARLNADVIDDEDAIVIGMRLRLPVR